MYNSRWVLFAVLAIPATVVVVWFLVLTRPKGRDPVRVDFDLYKGREASSRFVSKGR